MNRKQRRANDKMQPTNPAIAGVREAFAAAAQCHGDGHLAEAERLYGCVLAIEPRHADSLHRLGVLAHQQGRHALAADYLRKAIAQAPKVAAYHTHLALVLDALGMHQEAIACCRGAIALDPDLPDIHNNLGVMLVCAGQREEAAACYRKAIALDSRLAEVHDNLGNVLMELGRAKEAESSYRGLLSLLPESAAGHANLACALLAQGDARAALAAILKSLALEETPEAKKIFVQCVRDLRFEQDVGALRPLLLRALREGWDRPDDLARAAACLIVKGAAIAPLMSGPGLQPEACLAALAGDNLLRVLLCLTPNQDIALERLLVSTRQQLLQSAVGIEQLQNVDDDALIFSCALARQCFINEYVFPQTGEETGLAEALRDRLAAALESGSIISPYWVAVVAAYFPLFSIPRARILLDRAWPPAIEAILTQQICEPEEERELRSTMPQLTSIEDTVSRSVRAQYEENPYPRWVVAGAAGTAEDVTSYLRRTFPQSRILPVGRGASFDILVAGCGTGRNAVETTQKFKGARTLAIDLSLSSLAHAARKSHDAPQIEYAQADLLELGVLDRRFDLIEAVGVLHHLADPFAGWRALLSLLKPQGVMKVGLYSAYARRDLPQQRDGLSGAIPTAGDVRKVRQQLLCGDPDLALHPDFFTISTCRDLLFHVQEQSVPLDAIDDFLRRQNLTFLGFDLDASVLALYRERFADDPGARDLDHWQEFEAVNPDIFSGMYQFWLQKGPSLS